MARKSSKTAHVMNLLAGDDSESAGTVKELTVLAQKTSIQTQDGTSSPSPISIIDMSSSASDPVAELIKHHLEEEETSETADSSLQPEESEPVSSVQKEQSGQPPVSESSVTDTPSYKYLNVMEYVVKSRVEEYMEKFDVCSCGRCTADVTALTLTHLPPKYIVVEPPSASPLLNYYSNRLAQQIIVELTKACSIVKENPHH